MVFLVGGQGHPDLPGDQGDLPREGDVAEKWAGGDQGERWEILQAGGKGSLRAGGRGQGSALSSSSWAPDSVLSPPSCWP